MVGNYDESRARVKQLVEEAKMHLPYGQRVNGKHWTWEELRGLLSRIVHATYNEGYNDGYEDAKQVTE